MKILYTNFHTEPGGGHATYILSLYGELRKRHQIHIAVPQSCALELRAPNIPPEVLHGLEYPGKLKELPRIVVNGLKLRALIQQNQYDVIHVNGSPDHRLVFLATMGLRHKPAIVYTKHNSFPLSRNRLSQNRYRLHTDHIIVVCGRQKGMFEDVGVHEKHISVIKNGVDTAYFSPYSAQQRSEIRTRLGLAENDLVLVSVAGTALHKGWQYLVEAASRVLSKNIKIIVVGDTPGKDVQARHVAAFNMTERVIFPGPMADVRPYIAAGDIGFVLSNAVETISFACREMMAMGKPALVSNFACLPENVVPSKSGWVVEVGDVAAIRDVIEWALDHRGQLCAMGETARLQAVNEFGVAQFARETESVYEEVVAKRRKFGAPTCAGNPPN